MKYPCSMRFSSRLAAALTLVPFLTSSLAGANELDSSLRVARDIQYLASDELEGRGPGTDGLAKAAEYIRDEFKRFGLKSGTNDGSYMQPLEIVIDTKVVEAKTLLVLNGPEGQRLKLELRKDFQPLAIGGGGTISADIAFAGYGISSSEQKYDDYENSDIAGKVVLIIRREPQQGDVNSVFEGKKTTTHSYIHTKVQAAKRHKAAAILLVNDSYSLRSEKGDPLTSPSAFGTRPMGIPFAHITRATANKLFAATPVRTTEAGELQSVAAIENEIDRKLQPLTQAMEGWTAQLEFEFEKQVCEVANVVGVLEGEGELAHETVVLGAHYDHLGYGPFGSRKPAVRAIHNGADDNASGTSCVMELARRFSEREGAPRRRMVFICFTAEERGIIGSNYYIQNPLFPLEDTVAMLNFDMVGRLGDKGLIVGGVRTARQFPDLARKANDERELKVNTSGPIGGSDHTGFYRKGIPVLFFFTGLTEEYHTPDDDFDTINVAGVVKTVNYAERLLVELVQLPVRPEYVRTNQPPRGRGAMAYLGIVPDYAGTAGGLGVSDVNADSPADKGGLKAGDVIVKFADAAVADIQGLSAGLRSHKAGDKVKIVVRRAGDEVALDVTLGKPPGR